MLELATIALLLPLLCFALLAAWPGLRRRGKLAGAVSCCVAVISFFCALGVLWEVDPAAPMVDLFPWLVSDGKTIASVGLHLDGISAPMLVVVTLVAACVQIYSLGYLDHDPEETLGRYFAWHSLFIFSMAGLVVAPNLLQAFICWELVGLCSYLLIGFYWQKPSAGKAAVKAFWVTKFADIGLMLGIIVLYVAAGSFSWNVTLDPGVATAVAALIFLGVMGKSAQVPFHIWLPDAMEGPTPVSALLHAATMVAAGVFLVVRAYPLFEQAPMVLDAMTWIGAITAFCAACMALAQDDIKKVLAYSTCSQLGYMVAALGAGSMMAGYFHLTTHAFFKALLFLGAGAAIHAVNSNDIHDMGALLKRIPVSGALFIIGALALAGVPVFAGFFSKDLILEMLLASGHLVPLVLLVISAALTALYMTRVVVIAFLGTPAQPGQVVAPTPSSMEWPMMVLGALSIGAGFLGADFARLVGAQYHFHLAPVGILTVGLGLAAILIGYLRWDRGHAVLPQVDGLRAFIRSGPIDKAAETAWREGLLPLARTVGWIDRYLVDGIINLVAWTALKGTEAIRALQTGRVQDYVYAVIVGIFLFVAYGAVWG